MDIVPLGIDGAFLVRPTIHADDRGSFHEWFRSDRLRAATGRDFPVAQANWSVSGHGTIRGIHFSRFPLSQAKLVTCPEGAVWDVVVDVRAGSPDFGRWVAIELSAENRHAVLVGEGLGHGFMATSDRSTVMYLCSTPYSPERESEVNPLDPAIGIAWPTTGKPIMSAKDADAPALALARDRGELPAMEDWRKHAESQSH